MLLDAWLNGRNFLVFCQYINGSFSYVWNKSWSKIMNHQLTIAVYVCMYLNEKSFNLFVLSIYLFIHYKKTFGNATKKGLSFKHGHILNHFFIWSNYYVLLIYYSDHFCFQSQMIAPVCDFISVLSLVWRKIQ